jgi:hypothetical protein
MTEMHWFIKGEADSDDTLDSSSENSLSAVFEAVLALDETGSLSPKNRMLLTLLTYCYARGLYSAEAIECATHHHPTVRYICARDYPGAAEIREFRRNRKDLVIKALTNAFETLCWQGLCEVSARQESERRVAKAIQWDSFELDL